MTLIHNHQLSEEQIVALDALVAACEKCDEGKPAYYRHLLVEKREALNILYYEKQQLLGCLTVFYFYDQACEISLLVHPNYRRQHIATQLLREILPELLRKQYENVIFSCAKSQFLWLKTLGLKEEESEYNMIRYAHTLLPPHSDHLDISFAHSKDIPLLFSIDKACFTEPKPRSLVQFMQWLQRPDYKIIIAEYRQQIIGKAHIRIITPQQATLSDIAILPAFQKRGFGSELLNKTIRQVYTSLEATQPQLTLTVSTHNSSNALKLYLDHGFEITSQCDYWSIPLVKLANFPSILDSLS